MNFFKNIFKGPEKDQKQEGSRIDKDGMNKGLELGAVNRYENNPDLQEEINQEAKMIAKKAGVILRMLEENPNKANFHSEISGSRWNIHYINEDVREELEGLYGTNLDNVSRIESVPDEIKDFLKKRNEIITIVNRENNI